MSASQATPGSAALTGPPLLVAAICLSLANFMVVLDTTVANVSVPHIAGALAVSPTEGTWVLTSYSVAEAVTVPLTGWLAQRFGALKVFMGCMAGFGLCSALCGLAPSFGLLVTARVMQGLCGGPVMPMSQTLLLSIFPQNKARNAIGIWSMTMYVAPIFGPTVGGIISDGVGWNWIFLVNVPVVAAAVIGASMVLGGTNAPGRRVPIDYVGLGLLALWVGSVQIMLDKGRELEWFSSPAIISLAIAAAIGFCAFLIWELTAENPIVNLRIFRHRGFVGGVTAVAIVHGAFISTQVLTPLWLQTTMGYTATQAGWVASMNGFFSVLMSPVVTRLMGKVDLRKLASFGVSGMALIALWRTCFTTDATFWTVAVTFLAQGMVIPFTFIPTVAISLTSVLPGETAAAAGLQSFLRTMSAAFSTSLLTTLWENAAQARHSDLAGRLHNAPWTATMMQSHGLSPDQTIEAIERLVQTQSVMLATNQMFMIATVVFATAVACLWIAPKRRMAGRA